MKQPMEAGLSLGSNLGDRLRNLQNARRLALANPAVRLAAAAPVYECEPVGVPAESVRLFFLNSVLIAETSLSLDALMGHLRSVELEMGRKPAPKNAPRIIDIDIIYANGLQVNKPGLVVPHPRWFLRRFVVQPLCDVRPNLNVPGQSVTVSMVLSRLSDDSRVERFADDW